MTVSYRNKNIIYFCLAALINIAFYLYLIIRHPYFLTDDFLNFGIIVKNFSNFTCFNIPEVSNYEKFYFYTRPITYIISLIDLKLFGSNSFHIKIFSLCLHTIMLFSFYSLLKQLFVLFKLEVSGMTALLILIFFGLHPNNMWWIYWISNQNEMLMITFYILSIYSVLSYINKSEKKYLILYLTFFTLSILTKQQPLHLPILILLWIYYYKNNLSAEKFHKLRNYSFAGAAIMIIYSAYTFMLSINNFKAEYLIKKPFALAGNLLYVIFPLNSLSNYEYFTAHKPAAFIAALIVVAVFAALLYFKKIRLKTLLILIFTIIVSFYPRIIDGANNRINTIQVLLFSILLVFILSSNYRFKKYYFSGVILLIFFNTIELNSLLTYYNSLRNTQQVQAAEYLKSENNTRTSAISFWAHLLPYETYFLRTNTFGKDEYKMIPLSYSSLNSGKAFLHNIKVECVMRQDALDIRTVEDPEVRIDIDNFNKDSDKYKYLQNDINYDKGFIDLTFPLSEIYKNNKLIYFNGLKWVPIN